MGAKRLPEIQDKVCVVTGGSNGIGKAYCEAFVKHGARVVVVADINEIEGQKTVEYLSNYSQGYETLVEFIYCDVSTRSNITELIQSVIKKFGMIHVFAANAGILRRNAMNLENFDEVSFNKILAVNTLHPVWSAAELVPFWLSHRRNEKADFCFIVTASAAGLVTEIFRMPYTVSKTAAVAFSEFMAINYGSKGIKTICVCPQAINTNMAQAATGDDQKSATAVDGILEPTSVSEAVIEAIEKNECLVLTHKRTGLYLKRRANDHNRWLQGMQKLRSRV